MPCLLAIPNTVLPGFENVIDYLDEPGEWCVNTLEGKIYYWPEGGMPSEDIVAPQLMEYIRVGGGYPV